MRVTVSYSARQSYKLIAFIASPLGRVNPPVTAPGFKRKGIPNSSLPSCLYYT